jgi:xanthine dehydrogenase YagT iron-sulfur-binding subunit
VHNSDDLRVVLEQVARPRQVTGEMIGHRGQVATIDDEPRQRHDVALVWCCPGQIMSAIGLIQEGQAGDDRERGREAMSGNLWRCGLMRGSPRR